MKITRQVFASLGTLLAACLLHAADPKPVSYVMSILDVETDDPSGYATWIAQYNAAAKAKLGIDNYLRVYQSGFDARPTGRVRVVTSAASVVEMMKNTKALENDPAIMQNRDHLRAIRKLGARVLHQAVQRDGSYPNGSVYTTLASVSDEAAYARALDQLRGIYASLGMTDVKINFYRVVAGRTDHTHRISINLPSNERLGAFIDAAGTSPRVLAWLADAAKYRTVVANFTAREITK
jgi:hypothetical protein